MYGMSDISKIFCQEAFVKLKGESHLYFLFISLKSSKLEFYVIQYKIVRGSVVYMFNPS